jgi:hypothetical protein
VPGHAICLSSAPQGGNVAETAAPSPKPQGTPPPPSSVDNWGAYMNTKDCMWQVHDQGACDWCVAHAVTGFLEGEICRAKKLGAQVQLPPNPSVSVPHLLWTAGLVGAHPTEVALDPLACAGGWWVEDAMGALATTGSPIVPDLGILDDFEWPASSLMADYGPPHFPTPKTAEEVRAGKKAQLDYEEALSARIPSAPRQRARGRYALENIRSIPGNDSSALKVAVASGENVVYTFPVFKDVGWHPGDDKHGLIRKRERPGVCTCKGSEGISGYTACADDDQKECLLGFHAVLITGYDDDVQGGTVVVRNSWSIGWPQVSAKTAEDVGGGMGRITYAAIDQYGEGGWQGDIVVRPFEITQVQGTVWHPNQASSLTIDFRGGAYEPLSVEGKLLACSAGTCTEGTAPYSYDGQSLMNSFIFCDGYYPEGSYPSKWRLTLIDGLGQRSAPFDSEFTCVSP